MTHRIATRESSKSFDAGRRLRSLGIFAIGYILFLGIAAAAQDQTGTPQTKGQLEGLIYSLKGPDLFRAHCAACHGADGRGGGPVAAGLKAKVPDLTVLSKSNGGQFPTERIRKIIGGNDMAPSHGTREMPIWGPIFHQVEEDRDYGNVRIENLIKYLQSIQQK